MEYVDINEFIGKTLEKIEVDREDDTIKFLFTNGETYIMFHNQDCCERVNIEDIYGDTEDLIGTPILIASCVTQKGKEKDYGSSTWSFYKLATVNGYVDIRWYGSSNGYYSERVTVAKIIGERTCV